MTDDERNVLIEKLAALCHEQWSGWAQWMLNKLESWGRESWIRRWRRQIDTPYERLAEQEKESDRIEAHRIMDMFENNASVILLNEAEYEAVIRILEESPGPNKELRKLLASKSPWKETT